MDFSKKLQEEVDKYNALVEKEQEADRAVTAVREERIAAFGRVRATEELLQEQLKEASLAAGSSSNGHVDAEIVDAELVDKIEADGNAT